MTLVIKKSFLIPIVSSGWIPSLNPTEITFLSTTHVMISLTFSASVFKFIIGVGNSEYNMATTSF